MLDTGLAGQTALVTGGASGIGQSIAVALAAEDVNVLVADLRDASETMRMIKDVGGHGSSTIADLRQEDQINRMVTTAISELRHLDLFVNVAAVYTAEAITRVSAESWANVLATNVTACALASRQIARHMISRRHGAILIVGSTVVSAPSYAGAAYRASKAALRSYMETLAVELAPFKIRVNMLTPGAFPTRLGDDLPQDQRVAGAREIPLGREGRLPEVRTAALYLLSDVLASYVTGSELWVDGGWHLRPLYLGGPEEIRRLNA